MAHDAHPTGEGNAPGSLQQPGVTTPRASKEAPARPSTCPTRSLFSPPWTQGPVKREAEDLYGTLHHRRLPATCSQMGLLVPRNGTRDTICSKTDLVKVKVLNHSTTY